MNHRASDPAGSSLRAVALGGDLAGPETPVRLAGRAAAELGPIDVLVADAGYAAPQGYRDADVGTWDRTLAVNLRAPFHMAQAVPPGMVERGYGRPEEVADLTVAVLRNGYLTDQVIGLNGGIHPR